MLAVKISADVSAVFIVESRFQTAIPSAKPAAIAAPSAVVSGIDGRTNARMQSHHISTYIHVTSIFYAFIMQTEFFLRICRLTAEDSWGSHVPCGLVMLFTI